MQKVLNFLLFIAAGAIISHSFTSMVLHQKILPPRHLLDQSVVFGQDQLGEILFHVDEIQGKKVANAKDSYIEISNLANLTKSGLQSISFDASFSSSQNLNYTVYYSTDGSRYSNNRFYKQPLVNGENYISFPPYLSHVDSLRINLCDYKYLGIEINKVTINPYAQYCWTLFFGIFVLYTLLLINHWKLSSRQSIQAGL